MAKRVEARIGISGWRYPRWRGRWYPKGLAQRRELEFASREFPSIEINGSFYSLQHVASWKRWYAETPDDFVFAVKGPRYVTHMLKLAGAESALANFFASGILALNEKLGPILWQLPPFLRYDRARLEDFFAQLPRDTAEALALAKRHDARMNGRTELAIDAKRAIRHAIEIRHESFLVEEFVALLRRWKVAPVVADAASRYPLVEDVTADYVYVRLHGDVELYASGYTDASLDDWARRIRAWRAGSEVGDARKISGRAPPKRAGRDVYVYFDNDAKVHAPFDARRLIDRLENRWKP